MEDVILDTDILSEVLKGQHQHVLATARQYLSVHQRFSFSEITVYEIVRGLRAVRAKRALYSSLTRVSASDVYPINRKVLLRAAELWVYANTHGKSKNDADLLI